MNSLEFIILIIIFLALFTLNTSFNMVIAKKSTSIAEKSVKETKVTEFASKVYEACKRIPKGNIIRMILYILIYR